MTRSAKALASVRAAVETNTSLTEVRHEAQARDHIHSAEQEQLPHTALTIVTETTQV